MKRKILELESHKTQFQLSVFYQIYKQNAYFSHQIVSFKNANIIYFTHLALICVFIHEIIFKELYFIVYSSFSMKYEIKHVTAKTDILSIVLGRIEPGQHLF